MKREKALEPAKESFSFVQAVHALVFGLLSAAAVGLGLEEARQLLFALSQPYHFGDPPAFFPLLGAVLGAACAALLLFHLARRKSVPLWVSALALVGVSMGYLGRQGDAPQRRSHHSANLDVLAAARQLHRAQVDVLQATGAISADAASWKDALSKLELPSSPARTRGFARLPFELVTVTDPNTSLSGYRPGTLVVWTSTDGVEFSIRAVGFDENNHPAPLSDKSGNPVVLTGAFNPNLKPSAVKDLNLDALQPIEQPIR